MGFNSGFKGLRVVQVVWIKSGRYHWHRIDHL